MKCTLPYTYYQPYVSSGQIPDEMFFGRKKELNSILDSYGASFLYGGRQLGKTALLLRASSVSHNPAEKKFGLYLNINKLNKKDFVQKLSQTLLNKEYGLVKKKHQTLESLCQELSKCFDEGKIQTLKLFIDEADTFLKEISVNNYMDLKPLVDLKDYTGSDFKFVFAGLHNVARSKEAMDKNSIFQQLGAPLAIEPLDPLDARRLVEVPLSYLGFKLDRKLLPLILTSTNYYPGLIHYYCATLIEQVASNYRTYYSAKENPPYVLTDDQLRKVLASGTINDGLKARIHMTLELDEQKRYKAIAYIMSYKIYQERELLLNISGFSARDIQKAAQDIGIQSLSKASLDELTTLLDEMVKMGILWKEEEHYRFRKVIS